MNCAKGTLGCNSIHGAKREFMAKPIHDAYASIHLQKRTEQERKAFSFYSCSYLCFSIKRCYKFSFSHSYLYILLLSSIFTRIYSGFFINIPSFVICSSTSFSRANSFLISFGIHIRPSLSISFLTPTLGKRE